MRNVTKLLQMLFVVMLTAFMFATQGTAQSTLLTESFENGGAVPVGWTTEIVAPSCPIGFPSASAWPSGYSAYNGTYMVQFESFNYSSGQTRLKQTTSFSTVGYTNVAIDFAWLESTGYSGSADKVDVQWSTNGTTWNTAGTFNRYNAVPGWKIKSVSLPGGAQGQATLYIAFLFTSAYGDNCHLDFTHVTAIGPPPPATITVGTGTVSCNYPYTTYWMGGRTQLLYTAAQMTAAGATPGLISTIGFNVYSYSGQNMVNFNINMLNTPMTSIASWVSGMTNCFSGNYAVPGIGWQMITLQNPFIWDGQNLLIEICYGNNGSYTSYSYVYGTTAPAGQIRPYWADGMAGCSYSGSPYTGYTGLPNLRFVEQPYVGTLTGTVTNNYNGLPLNAASITVPGMPGATTNASGVYTMYNVPIGNKSVTASMTGFIPQTKQATILNQQTTTVDFALDPIPAVLSGFVFNAANGNPIVGAELTVNGAKFYSTAGGAYTCNVYPGGTFNTTCGKWGFDQALQTFTYVQGVTQNYNWGLWENTNAPYAVTAALNTAETQVDINWLLPRGFYLQIYDDGIPENFTVWATAGNRNAVKFTPVGYPYGVSGGYVNIGTVNDYPSGANPLVPFQVAVYDATGAGGTPGVAIDTFDVTPTGYGWNYFAFPYPLNFTSGSFYLVMIQGGNAPDAAGIAVDETAPQLRSYASFNNGIWVPAGGNFLMRALIYGSGGPLLLDNSEPPAPIFVEGHAADGAQYNNPPTIASGFEGKGRVQAFDWSTLAPPSVTDGSTPPPSGIQAPASDIGQGGQPIPERTKPLTTRAVLYDNGPIVNSPGTGAGGADESVLLSPLVNYGFNMNNAIPYTITDDFSVTGGNWNVSSVEAFGYQTGSTTTSTFTGLFVRIWSGVPGSAGATVIWGDLTTNRLSSNTFSNIYRVQTPGGTQTTRPIMHLVANTPGLTLSPGFYWIEMAATGSLASGPWMPPITITGQPTTGNAMQWTGASFVPIVDGTNPQGVPFILNGTVVAAGNMNYEVWRLKQGEETTPGVWVSLGQTTATSATDTWTLPCGPYRWAVEAIYPINRYSPPAFSNVLGKCWTAAVTVNVGLTCAANPLENSMVKLTNNAYPDTMYLGMTDVTGAVVFPAVWKGNYTLNVSRFTYPLYTQIVDIMGDMTIDVMMLQEKTPPTNMFVDDHSLLASWNSPRTAVEMFAETWTSGNFTANQWVVNGGNWSVTTGFGNPAPSAQWYYYPTQTQYNQYLTSKDFTGIYAPQQLLNYDIYLSNYSLTNENTLAVELWDGATWHVLKSYTNLNGNINWTSESLDISAYNDITFKIRFHTAGVDSYDINNWNIDNIYIISTDGSTGYNPCVIGYNLYLNAVQIAFTSDTTYQIPPNLVTYGTTYNACVNAVYGSGYSTLDCYTFTSWFLYPPRELTVEGIECNAYLTWLKPETAGDVQRLSVPAFEGKVEHTTPDAGPAPRTAGSPVNQDSPTGVLGSIAFGFEALGLFSMDFDVDNVGSYTALGAGPYFFNGYAMPTGQNTFVYAVLYGGGNLYTVDRATGNYVIVGAMGGTSFNEITLDPTDGTIYGTDGNNLYTIDPTVPSYTNIGAHVNSNLMICLAADQAGNLWAYDIGNDMFYSLDKTTGLATTVGSIGYNANYAQGMFYDQATASIMMAGYNLANSMCEIRQVDVTTGASVILSSASGIEIAACALPITGGGGMTPPGLIGYNVYRDGAFIAYVSGQDTTWYYDLNLDPDTYEYAVTAVYDLTDYGFPGQFDESLIEGPESVNILCGRPLPFFEPWDNASFSYNDWTFSPVQGNWSMNSGLGNPAPTADFSWQPMLYDYEYALESPVLNAGPWTCAALWLDFDYKLVDRNATGDELLSVEVFYNGTWHQKAEYANNGSVDWTSEHFDISSAQGKALKVRFVAMGAASEDILHWYVDNIHVYGICNPPVDLVNTDIQDLTVILSWTPPTCEGGGGGGTVMAFIFDDGTAENGWAINPGYTQWIGNEFPIAPTYQGVIQSFDVFFYYTPPGPDMMSIDIFDASQTIVGSSDPFAQPDNTWANVLVNDVPFSGMFYGMVKWNNVSSATNYLGIDEDGPFSADDLEWYYDGTTWDKFSNMGYNAGVMLVRATALVGGDLKTVDLVAGQKPTGHITTTGALSQSNSYFDTKNYGTTGVLDNETDSSQIIGYNVYRQDPNAIDFVKVNSSLIVATTYTETVPDYGIYNYYVTSNFNDSQDNTFLCESPASNIVVADVMIGVPQWDKGQLMIYPNPATEVVNVKSTTTISTIEVVNFVGQAVSTMNTVDSKTAQINVTTLRSGVYFIKVTTAEGVRITKITVTH